MLLALVSVTAAGCVAYVKVPVVTKMPEGFMETMRGGKKVGIVFVPPKQPPSWFAQMDWSRVILGEANNMLVRYRYFKIVDVSQKTRQARLQEIARSSSGMTGGTKTIGKELSIDGLIFFEIPQQPLTNCRVTSRLVRVCRAYSRYCSSRYSDGRCSNWSRRCDYWGTERRYTAIRTTTVFLQARLVNVETGLSKAFSNSEPYTSRVHGPSCASALDNFNKAAIIAAGKVIARISPVVSDLKVPTEIKPIGVPDKLQKKVNLLMEVGNKYAQADPPDFDSAKDKWQEALKASGHTSASAYWNLAIYNWYSGNLDKAEEYFKKAEKAGGPGYATGSPGCMGEPRVNFLSRFKKEKKRITVERKAEDK